MEQHQKELIEVELLFIMESESMMIQNYQLLIDRN